MYISMDTQGGRNPDPNSSRPFKHLVSSENVPLWAVPVSLSRALSSRANVEVHYSLKHTRQCLVSPMASPNRQKVE